MSADFLRIPTPRLYDDSMCRIFGLSLLILYVITTLPVIVKIFVATPGSRGTHEDRTFENDSAATTTAAAAVIHWFPGKHFLWRWKDPGCDELRTQLTSAARQKHVMRAINKMKTSILRRQQKELRTMRSWLLAIRGGLKGCYMTSDTCRIELGVEETTRHEINQQLTLLKRAYDHMNSELRHCQSEIAKLPTGFSVMSFMVGLMVLSGMMFSCVYLRRKRRSTQMTPSTIRANRKLTRRHLSGIPHRQKLIPNPNPRPSSVDNNVSRRSAGPCSTFNHEPQTIGDYIDIKARRIRKYSCDLQHELGGCLSE